MRKIIKSSNTEEINTFRLHYFPNIPAPSSDRKTASSSADAHVKTGVRPSDADGRPSPAPEDPDVLRRREAERQGYEAGLAKGEQVGLEAARQQTEPMLQALGATLAELDGVRRRVRRHLEQEVVALALQVARKVIRHELTVSDDAILCVVKEAMEGMDSPGNVTIRLNPEDVKRIRGAGPRMADVMDRHENIQFEEDPGIACGGCYIQTEFGDIDARIEQQLHKIEDAFRAQLQSPSPDQEGSA